VIKFPFSISKKITLGYILSITIIIGGAIFSYSNIRMIENKIMVSNIFSELFETTLEIRRFEKNYFLYEKETDYLAILRFVDKASILVATNREKFRGFVSLPSISNLEKTLIEYRKLAADNRITLQRDINLEKTVREKGKELVTIAEDITNAERGRIQALLSISQRLIVIFTFFLVIIGVVFGYVLLRTITKPLSLLQGSMERISRGGYERVSIDSSDREIISLSEAFNRMLRELEWRQRQLVQSEKLASLGTLLSGMAHELNNPLSNIYTSYQILNEEIEGADVEFKKELLAQIGEQTERAKDFVRSILEFSRAKELKKESLSLKKLVDETISFVRGEVPTEVGLRVDVPNEITIYADKQRIQQVFLNLIKNAIDAVSGKGTVTIVARTVPGKESVDFESPVFLNNQKEIPLKNDTDDRTVYIKVQDNGVGIEPESISKIFDPFFTTKDVGKGSGLGLFITHSIIEEHGGSIKVKSQIGQGTTFLIQLPQKEI